MCELRVQSLDSHSDQMTLTGLIHKANLHSKGAQPKHPKMIKSTGEEGGDKKKKRTGKRGINELSQIKPCSYCTLETCCHGSTKGREEQKALEGPLEVKERKSERAESHTETCY